jgi:AcrR family transcriptional regulator
MKRAVTEEEQDVESWLRQGKLPEIKASLQQRSVRTACALVQSGFRLVGERAFDALSVQEICAGAGATEGAFYGRFQDKGSFFVVLQRITCLRSEQALAQFLERLRGKDLPFERLCRMVVAMMVERYRANVGIFRAALLHVDEGAWELFRQLGDIYRRGLTGLLAPHLDGVRKELRALRVQFAYQVIVGTLVHATLNDPGPLHLHDDAIVAELSNMLAKYLRGA